MAVRATSLAFFLCAIVLSGVAAAERPGAKLEELGRPVVAHDFEAHSAVEDVNQLVAGEMPFPMIFPGGLEGQKQAVAVGSQLCDASLAIRRRRTGGPPEHCQLRDFCVEVDDAGRFAFHVLLRRLSVPLPQAGAIAEFW